MNPAPMQPEIVLIASVAKNLTIGYAGDLVQHHPSDMAHFSRMTRGSPCIMGRKTWDSIRYPHRPLRDRENIVVSSHKGEWLFPGATVFATPDEAMEHALAACTERVFVIGGGTLYRHFLPRADTMILTEWSQVAIGDTTFPRWDGTDFELVERIVPKFPQAADRFTFATYRRRSSPYYVQPNAA